MKYAFILAALVLIAGCAVHTATVPPVGQIARPYVYQTNDPGGWISFNTPSQMWRFTAGHDLGLWGAAYADSVVRVGMDGKLTSYPHPGLSYQYPITANPDGNIYAVESTGQGFAVAQITPQGNITDFPLPLGVNPQEPQDMTSGSDGNLWIVGTNPSTLGRMTTAGIYTDFTPKDMTASPQSITRGPDKNLWVNANVLYRIGTDGTATEFGSVAGDLMEGDATVWAHQGTQLVRIDMLGNETSYLVPSSSFGVAGPNHLIYLVGKDHIDEFSQVKLVVTGRIPTAPGAGGPLCIGPDGQLWSAGVSNGQFMVDVYLLHPLVATPSSVLVGVGQNTLLSIVEKRAYTKSFTAVSLDPSIATVAPAAQAKTGGQNFTVTGVAQGSTIITVSDSIGNTLNVAVTVQ